MASISVAKPENMERAVRLLFYIGGAISTFVGSWLSSKIHVYHDARNNHRDELKDRILESLRFALQSDYENPQFVLDWTAQQYDALAAVNQSPVIFGPMLMFVDPGPKTQKKLDEALFEDALENHHRNLILGWEKFRDAWTVYLGHLQDWLQNMAEEILSGANLPAHPAPTLSRTYVMHLALAEFIYKRVMQLDPGHLVVSPMEGVRWVLSDGGRNLAAGSKEQMDGIVNLLNTCMETNKPRAAETQRELNGLQGHRTALLSQFSLAIAAKKLKARCQLVRFF